MGCSTPRIAWAHAPSLASQGRAVCWDLVLGLRLTPNDANLRRQDFDSRQMHSCDLAWFGVIARLLSSLRICAR